MRQFANQKALINYAESNSSVLQKLYIAPANTKIAMINCKTRPLVRTVVSPSTTFPKASMISRKP
jgi:hypothetical protein